MFKTAEVNRVEIVVDRTSVLKGAIVKFSIEINEEIIWRVFHEAQKKYQRMHYGKPELRFDKSWTGEIGENTVKKILGEIFRLKIFPKPQKLTETGYDYGDVHFGKSLDSNEKLIANVTSRKLSKYDDEINVFVKPDQYYILIPRDQLSQYTKRSDFCFPVFIKYTKYRKNFVLNDLKINIPIEGISVIPGFLTNRDIESLVKKKLLL